MHLPSRSVVNFSNLHQLDTEVISKKVHQLAELMSLGIKIPEGFVITHLGKLSENLIYEIHREYRKISDALLESPVNIFASSDKDNHFLHFDNIKGDSNLIKKIKEIKDNPLFTNCSIVIEKVMHSKTNGKINTNDSNIEDSKLKEIAQKIQKHFYFPYEIHYVKSKNQITITRIAPHTGHANPSFSIEKFFPKNLIINHAVSIFPGIVTGPAKIIKDKFTQINPGEIAIVGRIEKDMLHMLKKAKGIIADSDFLQDDHKSFISHILQIPTLINAKRATKDIPDGKIITINSTKNHIYSGGVI